MAFPTTGVLDTFNRANGPVGSNWSQLFASSGLTITSNQVANDGATGAGEMYWNPTTFGPDVECFATWATVIGGSALLLWIIVSGSLPGSPNGYAIEVDQGSTAASIFKSTAGSLGILGATVTITAPAAGHRFGIERIGNNVSLYQDTGGGFGAAKGTRSDSTFTGVSRIGMSTVSTGDRIDDFSGGTVVTGPNYDQAAALVNEKIAFPMRQRANMPMIVGPRVESRVRVGRVGSGN